MVNASAEEETRVRAGEVRRASKRGEGFKNDDRNGPEVLGPSERALKGKES
jgi:hypothetical protein